MPVYIPEAKTVLDIEKNFGIIIRFLLKEWMLIWAGIKHTIDIMECKNLFKKQIAVVIDPTFIEWHTCNVL